MILRYPVDPSGDLAGVFNDPSEGLDIEASGRDAGRATTKHTISHLPGVLPIRKFPEISGGVK